MECGSSKLRDLTGCALVADALRIGAEIRLRVTGTSMLPAVWPGDTLRVRSISGTSLSRGGIALCLRDGRLSAHRVVGRSGAQLITRGDAMPQCDPPVPASEVLGIVIGIMRSDQAERPVGPSSLAQRMVAFGIRHSTSVYWLVLKMHQLRARMRELGSGYTAPRKSIVAD